MEPYNVKDYASMEFPRYDTEHLVEDILFDKVLLDGKKVKTKHVTSNEFVKNVEYK